MKTLFILCLLFFFTESFSQFQVKKLQIGENQRHLKDTFAFYQKLYSDVISAKEKDSIEQYFTSWYINKSKSFHKKFNEFYGKVISVHYGNQDSIKVEGKMYPMPAYASITIAGLDGLEYIYSIQADNLDLLKKTDFFKIAQSISTRSYNFRKDKREFFVQFDAVGTFSENPRVIGLKGVPGYRLRVIEVECEILKLKCLNFETDKHFEDRLETIN